LITSADVLLFIIMETTGIRVVEAIFAGFMALMSGSFLYTYIRAQPDQKAVIEGVFYPWCKNCSSPEINQLVGIIGSIITPHNIYFHSSLVLVNNLFLLK
jgi:NRAMP (natural resistance-associated macrophage protein)-like metal ion transporter